MRLVRARFVVGFSLCLAATLLAQYPGSQPVPDKFRKGFDAISMDAGKAILGYLAGPECQGRGSGQDGYQKAAEFCAARFKEYGLKPMGDNGTYFQNVPFSRSRVDPKQSGIDAGTTRIQGLRVTGNAADFDKTADVAFVQVTGSKTTMDSTEALKDKIVVVAASSDNTALRSQLRISDAIAVFTINPKAGPAGAWSNARPLQGGRTGGASANRPSNSPFASQLRADLTPAEAKALAQAVGVDPLMTVIDEAAAEGEKSSSGNKQIRVTAKSETQEFGVPNVVGLLEGSDPTLKAEYVGIGGHLDHMGVNAAGVVYPGADDDGSGSTAVMLVAKAYRESGIKPRRSILFMLFCAEEMGLIGSRYLTNNPMVPLDKMIAEFQMDMVGRDSEGVQNGDRNRVDKLEENHDTMRLVGSKRISTELDAMIQDLNSKYVNFKFKYDAEDVYTRSDHYNFAAKGIPIAFLFDGFHPDYHRPTDTVDKINFEKLTNAAKLFFLATSFAADRDKPFAKDVPQGGGLEPAGKPL